MKNIYKYCFMLVFMMAIASMGYSQKTVKGVITDAETSEPLIGATVLAVGSSSGTVTDISGNYSLNIPDGITTMEVSYTGYTTQKVEITGDVINIELASGSILDEVVVVGYGTLKTKEVTSSITSVKSEDFNVGNVNSPAQLLQGKVAGLTITSSGGDPNGKVGIRLRGLSTIGAQTEPLVIVDGVPGASLSNIDPRDIETIDVLKDGSAAAIYGTRGSSGVILVTTKKGKKGTSRITYGGNVSFEGISKTPEIASAAEFRAAGGNDVGSNTDWYDEISQTGFAQSHNLSLAGGTDQTSYRVSFNYRDQDGVVKNTGFDQINGSVSINQKALNDKLSIGLNMIATNRSSEIGFREAFRYATIANPTSAVYNEDGSFNHPSGFDSFNPVALVEQNVAEEETNELLTNIVATYEIIEGLKITGSYARQKKDISRNEYYPSDSRYGVSEGTAGALKSEEKEWNNLYEGIIAYKGNAGKVDYSVLAGTSFQQFNTSGFGASATGFLTDDNSYNQIAQASDFRTGNAAVGSYGQFYRLQAQFARATVNIDDTYFASASIRREGSDRFGEDNRYGIFPAISAGVDISKLADIKNVDNLKLRLGYGVTGNLPGENYLFQSIFVPGPQFFYNGNYVPSFGPQTNANPDLKWETKREVNFGIDFSLFDYKLTGALDIFNRTTEDLILLVAVPVPPNLAGNTWKNAAGFSTNGIELAVNYKLINNGNFSYTPGLIFTSYKTVLDEYNDSPSFFITNLGAPGQNITDAGVGLHFL
ncbi:MAG: TonB-linked SusC/RagA family outer membrane protein, partial [Flavobacteriales bacterium]